MEAEGGQSPMTLLRKPVSIVVVGLYYIISPFVNLATILWVTRLPFTGPVNLWSVLNPSDWAILVLFPIVGVGVFSVRRWGWFAFVGFSLFLIGYNTYSYLVNHTYSLGMVICYNLTLAAVTFYFFRKHLRAPYFNPRLRWWNADPRYQVSLRAQFSMNDSACDAEVLDISKSGVFLSICADIEVGQTHRISIDAYGRTVSCSGKVMRKTSAGSSNPGFGIMFEGLTQEERRELSLLIAHLIINGARERGWPSDAPLKSEPAYKHALWYARRLWREILGA